MQDDEGIHHVRFTSEQALEVKRALEEAWAQALEDRKPIVWEHTLEEEKVIVADLLKKLDAAIDARRLL